MKKRIRKYYLGVLVLVMAAMLCGCDSFRFQNKEPIDEGQDEQDEIASVSTNDAQPEDNTQSEPDNTFSAFNQWMEAENTVSERYMYEAMIEGFLIADDEIAHGWIDDGTTKFIRLIKGNAVPETATAQELAAAYRSLDDTIVNTHYSIRDFFTVDENGYSTNAGIYNFLDAINQLEGTKFNGADIVMNGENHSIIGWDFNVVGGDAAIADALGVTEEFVLIFEHAAIDAGFHVTFTD